MKGAKRAGKAGGPAFAAALCFFSLALPRLCAETGAFDFLPAAFLPPCGEISIVERSNFHRYVDGRNAGFVYRESRGGFSSLAAGEGGDGSRYAGELLVLEELYSDAGMASRKVDRSATLGLELGKVASFSPDRGFPSLRGLLASAPSSLEAGKSWSAPASIALDPRNSGDFTVLPVLVEYAVAGKGSYGGRDVIVVKGKFALRAGDYAGRPLQTGKENGALSAFSSVSGSHDLDIYVDEGGEGVLFIRDRFDESFAFAAGPAERHAGFRLVFMRGGSLESRDRIAAGLGAKSGASRQLPSAPEAASPAAAEKAQAASAPSSPSSPDTSLSSAGPAPLMPGDELSLDESSPLAKAGVDLLDSAQGIVLRVRDLRFVADSDEILASEKWRLDAIAASLAGIKEGSFLVEGHSASVGKPRGELELSGLRAKRVVGELVARGIAANRFVYRGLGSGRPIADNSTEEGRARNRRVEITILN